MVRDDGGWLGTMRDDRNWTRDAGMRLGIRSHTPLIWTGAKLGKHHHTVWEELGLD